MKDKNENSVPDKYEVIFTYLVATLCILAGMYALGIYENFNFAKWSFGFAATLTGGRDFIKGFMGGKK